MAAAAYTSVRTRKTVSGPLSEGLDNDDDERMPTKEIALDLVVRRQCISAVGVIWQKRRVVVTHDSIKFSKLPPEDMILDTVFLLDIQSVDSSLSLQQKQEYQLQTLRVQCFIEAHTKVLLVSPSDTIALVISSIDSAFQFDPLQHWVQYEGRGLDLGRSVEDQAIPDGATILVELRSASPHFLDVPAQPSDHSSTPLKLVRNMSAASVNDFASKSWGSLSDFRKKMQDRRGPTVYCQEDEEHECLVSVKCGDDEQGRTIVLSVSSGREGQEFVDVVRRLARAERKKLQERALRDKTFVARLQVSTYRYYYSSGGQVVSTLLILIAFAVTVLQAQVDLTIDSPMRQNLLRLEVFFTVGSVWVIHTLQRMPVPSSCLTLLSLSQIVFSVELMVLFLAYGFKGFFKHYWYVSRGCFL